MDPQRQPQSDHDLLIRLDEKLGGFSEAMSKLGTDIREVYALIRGFEQSIDAKISAAVGPKLDLNEYHEAKTAADKLHEDHERRLRRLEKYVWLAIGALAILELILKASGH